MSELYRVTVKSKIIADDVPTAGKALEASEIAVVLLRLQRKLAPAKLKKAPAATTFLETKDRVERFRAFGDMLAACPDIAEKVIVELTNASRKSGKVSDGITGWIQRQWLARACGGKKPESLAIVSIELESRHPDAQIPKYIQGDRLRAFIVALVAFHGLALKDNALLKYFDGVDGITRPTVAPAMTGPEKDAYSAKLRECVYACEKEAEISFAMPARFAAHLEPGESYDTTAWPVLGA